MGHPHLKTPVVDEMAEHGLRLDRFYSASPVCSPTRASCLSGRHPNRSGTFRHGHQLRPEERSVATLLRDAGYRTGFFGKWHIGSVQADRPTNPSAHGFETWSAAPNFYVNNPWLSRNGKAVPLQGESSMVTVEEALPFITDATQSGKPFLAYIWTGSPHDPHLATHELYALYADHPPEKANYYGEITGIFWHYDTEGHIMWSDRILKELYELQQAGQEEGVIVNEGVYHSPDLDYAEADDRPGPSVWMDGDWKFHRTDSGNFLYNLAEDIGEENNIISEHPKRAQRMQKALHKWEDSVIRSLRGEDY